MKGGLISVGPARMMFAAKVMKTGHYIKFTEEEIDNTGYGGSTETVYTFRRVKGVAKATLLPNRDFPSFPERYGLVRILKVSAQPVYTVYE